MSMWAWLLWPHLAMWPGLAMLSVDGNSDCPTPQAVQRRLAQVSTEDAGSGLRVSVERSEAAVRLLLRDGEQRIVAQRVFASDGDCEELAGKAAAAAAVWLARFAPPPIEPPPAPPPPPIRRTPPTRASPPAPPPASTTPPPQPLATEPPPAAKLSERPLVPIELDDAEPAGSGPLQLQLNLSALASLPSDLQLGGALGLQLLLEHRVLAAEVSTFGERETAVGTHRARFSRGSAALGVGYLRPVEPLELSILVAGAAGWLGIEGRDFSDNRRSLGFEPAALLEMRVSYPLGLGRREAGAVLWAGVGGQLWLRSQKVLSLPENAVTRLPQYDAWFKLGAGWRFGP